MAEVQLIGISRPVICLITDRISPNQKMLTEEQRHKSQACRTRGRGGFPGWTASPMKEALSVRIEADQRRPRRAGKKGQKR